MPAGRPPKPQAIAELHGNRRRRKCKEPQPPKGSPPMPEYLDEIAKTEWIDICNQLDSMNILSKADGRALELYCNCYSRYRRDQMEVAEKGIMIETKSKYQQKSTHACDMDTQEAKLKGWLVEFGLTPASRSRMRIDGKEKTKSSKLERPGNTTILKLTG